MINKGHVSIVISKWLWGRARTLWRLLCGLFLNRRHLQNKHQHKETKTKTNTNKETNLIRHKLVHKKEQKVLKSIKTNKQSHKTMHVKWSSVCMWCACEMHEQCMTRNSWSKVCETHNQCLKHVKNVKT